MRCFNEAAAVKPRKPCALVADRGCTCRFNEAAAVKPRKQEAGRGNICSPMVCFNEAAAVKPRKLFGFERTHEVGVGLQ